VEEGIISNGVARSADRFILSHRRTFSLSLFLSLIDALYRVVSTRKRSFQDPINRYRSDYRYPIVANLIKSFPRAERTEGERTNYSKRPQWIG